MTLYDLKPSFRRLLWPIARRLATLGVTANQVTVVTAALSFAVGGYVAANSVDRAVFLLITAWCCARMALNALDGILATGFGQRTSLGVYLNELGDVVSDAALYLPFALVAPFSVWSVGAVVLLSTCGELAGAIGAMVGTQRRYDGPMGKSDRAAVFALLGLWVAVAAPLPASAAWVMPALAALIGMTVIRRIRSGVRAADGLAERSTGQRQDSASMRR
jgi:CDP-diacylglycerol--glycerol-3-phosphate 3-phosphatidyltransferase